jgi:hypothetical protein
VAAGAEVGAGFLLLLNLSLDWKSLYSLCSLWGGACSCFISSKSLWFWNILDLESYDCFSELKDYSGSLRLLALWAGAALWKELEGLLSLSS